MVYPEDRAAELRTEAERQGFCLGRKLACEPPKSIGGHPQSVVMENGDVLRLDVNHLGYWG